MTDSGWLAEPPLSGWQQRIQATACLHDEQSAYQRIQVWETVPFGRALVLDGAIQTTQQDEFIYHEMLAYLPLLAHPEPRSVLVVGGGDGGCLRRVLEHPVERVVQVEIDRAVVDACLRWLPDISAGAFDDPRAELVIADAMAYLDQAGESFDVILVDSTDPVGAATPLFTERFYRAAARRLRPEGLLVTQSGSPLLMAQELRRVVTLLSRAIGPASVYLASVPSYPGVVWSFTGAGPGAGPARGSVREAARRSAEAGLRPRYYTPELQQAAFVLPAFLHRWLSSRTDGRVDLPLRSLPGESPVR